MTDDSIWKIDMRDDPAMANRRSKKNIYRRKRANRQTVDWNKQRTPIDLFIIFIYYILLDFMLVCIGCLSG